MSVSHRRRYDMTDRLEHTVIHGNGAEQSRATDSWRPEAGATQRWVMVGLTSGITVPQATRLQDQRCRRFVSCSSALRLFPSFPIPVCLRCPWPPPFPSPEIPAQLQLWPSPDHRHSPRDVFMASSVPHGSVIGVGFLCGGPTDAQLTCWTQSRVWPSVADGL